jgi:small nuclear ribonucleoprotein (snRNP)-like protein
MQGYDAAQAQSGLIGALQGYDAANADATTLGAAQGYSPAMIEAQQAYDAAMSAAQNIRGGRVSAQSLLTNLDDYMNPYINDVVDTTLAGFDENAGRIEAQQQAQAAQNGAFGGSRYGVLQAITQGELARERAGTEAGLRSDAFNTGASLSADDANRRQSASATNAQIATQEALARQQAEIRRAELMFAGAQGDQAAQNQASAFLADAQNSRTQLQGQLDQQRRLSDQSATNQARAFGADAANTGTLTQASFDQQTNLVNRDAQDAASQFAANANNNRTLTQAGLNQDANLSNRDALNQGLLAQLDADLSRSIADQNAQNTSRQFGAAQTGQQYLTQAGLDQEAMLSNQAAANRSSEFNANTINDLNRFNMSQADNALDRALRGADSLRTTGSTQEANERAAIGLLSELGAQERGVQQQQANADIALLSTIAQLFGGLPFGQVTGQTSSGTATQTQTPGLLDFINAGANVVGAVNQG